MSLLPIFKDDNTSLMLMQSKWSSSLNPVLKNQLVAGQPLEGIALNNGTTAINHMLGRMMQGWFMTDVNGSANIYRSQPFNSRTLTLTSNAAVVVNLWVF